MPSDIRNQPAPQANTGVRLLDEPHARELLASTFGSVSVELAATRRIGGWSFSHSPGHGETPIGSFRYVVSDGGVVRRLALYERANDAIEQLNVAGPEGTNMNLPCGPTAVTTGADEPVAEPIDSESNQYLTESWGFGLPAAIPGRSGRTLLSGDKAKTRIRRDIRSAIAQCKEAHRAGEEFDDEVRSFALPILAATAATILDCCRNSFVSVSKNDPLLPAYSWDGELPAFTGRRAEVYSVTILVPLDFGMLLTVRLAALFDGSVVSSPTPVPHTGFFDGDAKRDSSMKYDALLKDAAAVIDTLVGSSFQREARLRGFLPAYTV